ncbi:MAG: TIM-barrel domain-containing protein [Myxococcota bacterium]
MGLLVNGATTLRLTDAPRLELSYEGETRVVFEAGGWALGIGDAPADDATNYDPYRLYVPFSLYDVPPDWRFVTPTGAAFEPSDEGTLRLRLEYPEGLSAVVTARAEGDRFSLRFTPEGDRAFMVRLGARGDAREGFYGLGEYFDDVDHRGHVRALQIEADLELESAYNEAHVPVPMIQGTTGWGMFVRSAHPGAFAVATEADDVVEATFGLGTASGDGLPFDLFAAAHPLDLTRHYYDATGYPGLPARWALGPWVWRDENDDQAQVERDLQTMRDLDLATTGYWIDRPYATAVNTFDFDPGPFPDPPAMYAEMRRLGFETALWHTPYLDEESPATASLREAAAGYGPAEVALALNPWGDPLDFTNPDAVAFWREQLADYIDLGVKGFKLDYAEDVLAGLFVTRTPWRFADGSDERTMHATYQNHYHETYAALLPPEEGGFLLCRGGTYGGQTRGVIIWPGDLDADFVTHREPAVSRHSGERYVAVGGLPASIVAGLSLGPSGYPFFGADTGGYRHSPVEREVFMRWFEQTALSTVMQVGTSANDVAWEFRPENGFDASTLESYRAYTRLHLRLWPYLWSYVMRLAEDGRPIQRALGLAHPELGVHPNDVYLLGDHLLVAPVVTRGATQKTTPVPAGRWVHWFTGEVIEGPAAAVTVDAPLGRLPLFLHEDGIVPLLRPTIDTLSPTTAPDEVDSYATRPGPLYVRGVARGHGSFQLFDGGEITTTEGPAGTTTLTRGAGRELNDETFVALAAADAPPQDVSLPEVGSRDALEEAPEGWWYDAATATLWLKLRAGDAEATIRW